MTKATLSNGPNDLVKTPGKPHPSRTTPPRWRNPNGPLSWVTLLAGLLLLLFSLPAARAQGVPPGCTGSGIGITLYTSAPDVHVGDTICYGVLVFNGGVVGPLVCDASNIVAFIVTPDGVSHPVTLVHTYMVNGQSDYYPSNVCYVVRQQDIVSDGIGGSIVRATASDTATIYQNDKPSQGGANQGVNTEVSQPCIGLTVQCAGSVGQNGAITFNGFVTNCGNDTLVSVTITNLVNGGQFPVAFITNILVGQSAPFSGSWVPLSPCSPSTATVVASGTDQFTTHPRTVTSSTNTTCSDVLTPGIVVTKTCPAQPVAPGQLLTFSGSVSNSGNVTLNSILVVNNQPVPNTTVFAAASLAPGAITNFTASYLAPAACSISDTLIATAASTCGIPVTNTASATCSLATVPALAITQSCPAIAPIPGALLTYTGTVTNTGNITLTNVIVVNNLSGSTPIFTAATLASGTGASFTGSYLTPTNCSTTSTSTATGASVCGVPVTNSASSTCAISTMPVLLITQTCPAIATVPGALLTYSGTVTNAGNITITNVMILNNLSGSTPVFTAASLAPGVGASFTGSYLTPTNCSTTSTSIATGASVCGVAVANSASSTCAITTTPVLAVTQTCPASPTIPGMLLTYSGTVTNAGNITITNVVVLNNQSGSTPIYTAATLAPGAGASFTGSYSTPTNCSTTSTSTATGKSVCGVVVANSASSTCAIVTAPALAITQTCPAIPPVPGALLTYTGTVTNTGNITLTNIVVLNNQSGATPVLTVATLAPGAGASFSGSYLTPANCSTTSTSTATGASVCGMAVTNSASSTCAIATTTALVMTQNCPATPTAPGMLLTYSGTVTNAGNITITNVVILNNLSGATPVYTAASLAPGVGASFTGSYLTPTNCSTTSTSTATGTSVCGVAVVNSASSTCAVATAPALAMTQSCPAIPPVPGALLTYTGTVTNTGNITLTNIIVVNNQSGSTPVFTATTLASGAGASFSGSYLTPTNCSTTSISTATGASVCGVAVTNSASSTCEIATSGQLVIMQNCPAIPTVPGALLTYSGTVTNVGNITITNVVVLNNLSGSTPVFTAATLAAGTGFSFTGSYLTPTNCFTTSISTASGRSLCGTAITNTVSATCAISTTPVLGLTLNCPAIPPVPGALLIYTGTVTNLGNIIITNVVVVNNLSGATPIYTVATLAPGAGASFTGSYLTPTNCSTTSVSTASGESLCGIPVESTASATCEINVTPALVIVQACPTNPVFAGGLFTYTGSVSNAGSITLTNVVVQNSLSGVILTAVTLLPTQTTNFTGSYLAPTNCSTTSTSIAIGTSICGLAVTNWVTTTCAILTTPAIVVTLACPTNLVYPGGLLTYTGSVSNSGNFTLTNITVVNNRPAANTMICFRSTLAPGASANFSGSYVTPPDCCVVWSDVIASGQGCSGVTVTDEETTACLIATTPQIVITKVCNSGILHPGDLLTYSGSVSNAGNITLFDVAVADSASPANSPLPGYIDLAPGESVSFNGSYVVPPDSCGSDTLTASALDVCNYLLVEDSVTTTCPITTTPRITVTKHCPLLPTPRGGLYTYSGSVSNAGNVSLVNVYVTDDQPTNNTPVIGPITVAPGLAVNFTNSYVAPMCCCLIIDTLTVRGQDHCSGSNVTDTATAVCPMLTIPSLTVVPNCPANAIPMGSLYQFSGYVTNTGMVVLTNVWVFGPQGTNVVLGPVDLAPGQAEPYSGAYTVPFNTCSVSVTALGQETCGGTYATNTASCPVASLPAIAITENCPPGPVSAGSNVLIGGSVTNVGNITLVNVLVFSGQSSNSTPVLGPITLAPGASASFMSSYLVTGGSNPATNWMIITNGIGSTRTNLVSAIVTNKVITVTTNSGLPAFGTIDPVALSVTPRFSVTSTLHGLMYADQNENWGDTLFYAVSQPVIGVDTFDTIAPAGGVTSRFNLTSTNYDALTLAAPDVGYGVNNFYYVRHNSGGVTTFGEIIAQGASSSADLWVLAKSGYNGLTFAAANLGYGANLFYFLRTDVTGLSTFGTINPTPGGVATDLYPVGTNFDALVYVSGAVSTWGSSVFVYLRHNNTGSIIGTINPVTQVVTDRLSLGTNLLSGLTFAATDVGYGANLLYYSGQTSAGLLTNIATSFTTNMVATVTTNTVITYTTNMLVTFTSTNTVTATGVDVCQGRTVGAAANCLGPITSSPLISKPAKVNGSFSLNFQSQIGETYTLEYKNKLSDSTWTSLQAVPGTGGSLTITDPTAVGQPSRYYRILVAP